MQEKDLKILLQEYGFEETSPAFNNLVMQRIDTVLSKQTKPLLNGFILNLLKVVFFLIIISLIICCIFFPLNNLPSISFVDITSSVYKQIFSFVIVFWIMMFLNIWWNARKRTLEIISYE